MIFASSIPPLICSIPIFLKEEPFFLIDPLKNPKALQALGFEFIVK